MPITITVTTASTPLTEAAADTLLVGAFAAASGDDNSKDASGGSSERQPPLLAADGAACAEAIGIDLAAEAFALGFDGSLGAVAKIPTRATVPVATVTIVGLGKADDLDLPRLGRAAALAAKSLTHYRAVATSLHTAATSLDPTAAVRAVAEGFLLGAYRFDNYRTHASPWQLEQCTLHTAAVTSAVEKAVADATIVAQAVASTRDLVNIPPQDKRPARFAELVVEAVADLPVEVTVLDEAALADGGYGGILGVGQGSSAPPRFVELRYRPEDAKRHVALVGKGITFDSGGLSLKPSTAMETMKCDMAGAASVLAAVIAAARLGLPVEVTGLLALAENMPSGSATRVGDVLTMRGGTTVEVINTDAEGRLVLADALVRASEFEPDVIVDLATLTGAQVVALGERISAIIANDDALSDALVAAGTATGERLWPLPLAKDEYGARIKGNVADLKNVGNRAAGVIYGALFLEAFVGSDIPWAHLDIAGPAWTDEAYGEYTKGGTGSPVRALVAWLQSD